MTREDPPATAPRPVAFDLPCAQCGYNLRGLAPAGRCPECGLAIAESSYADAFVGPLPWLHTVTRGVEQLCIAMVVYVPVAPLAALLLVPFRPSAALLGPWAVWLGLESWHLYAVWRMATPQAADGPERGARRWRALFAAGGLWGLFAIAPLLALLPGPPAGRSSSLPLNLWAVGVLVVAALEAHAVLALGGSLAERLGARRIVWRSAWPDGLYGVSLCALAGLLIAPRFGLRSDPALLPAAVLGVLAGALWRFILLVNLYAALRRLCGRADYGLLRG